MKVVTTIGELTSRIATTDAAAAAAAREKIDCKTKPPGSLGRVEEVAVRLASIFAGTEFETWPRAVVVLAADHGVARRGVSAYPAEVTAQMVRNFAAGGAAVNVLARQMGVRTIVVDMGVAGVNDWPREVRRCALGAGTEDLSVRAAMSEVQAEAGVVAGAGIVDELRRDGCQLVATGEMGIGNTTAAAALTAVFTGRPPAAVTGRGTGVSGDRLARKVRIIEQALDRHRLSPNRPLEALARVGGFEIAGLVGLILGGAAAGIPILLDGFIAGAAALVATSLCPRAKSYLFAGHRSAEMGHGTALAALNLDPLLDLGLRLGEGTGALLALPILDAAGRLLREMASFESAGVSHAER